MQLEDINLRGPVRIGYYDPFDSFPPIQDDFLSRFPLSNLHWRHNPLKPVKSIPLLPVKLEAEVPSLHTKKTSKIDTSLNNVYARVMFVKTTDIEIYRSQVRPLINEWLKALVKPHKVSWAIVLVIPSGKKDKKSTIIKLSVFDKLKSDFEAGGKHVSLLHLPTDNLDSASETRQHVLKIHEEYSDEISKLEVYNDVVNTIKVMVLHTFNMKYLESSAVIDRLRNTPNSNPGDKLELFQERLRLASTFNDMRCLDESLELYEELYTELKKLDLGEAEISTTPSFLEGVDYKAFDPESFSGHIDPYYQFCLAVEQRLPIDVPAVKLGLFLKISILLQTLANFATSISISSIFISSLLQKAIALLNDFSQFYANSAPVDQWLFAMSDFYLNLPLAKKLLELDKVQAENQEGLSSVTGILEYLAEFKLFQRSIVNKLATRNGLKSPTDCLFFVDVSIQDISAEPSSNFIVDFSPLKKLLESQQSYDDFFEQLTISAIQDYANCDRIKTIDILSIDLAMLHYKKHEYKEALQILQNSYDYFIQNGWNYVGGILLEIYLDCIQHVEPESNEQFLNTTLKLFVSLNGSDTSKHGINDYNLVKNKTERSKLFQKVSSMSENIETCHEYPLEDIFAVEVEPYIEISDDDGRHYIRANIQNKFGIDFELLRVAITLVCADDSDDYRMVFSKQNVVIGEGAQTSIDLYTNKFCSRVFKVDQISVQVTRKLSFSTAVDHSATELADNTVIHHTALGETKMSSTIQGLSNVLLRMFPFPGQFRLEIAPPKKINLGSCSLECVVHNGPKQVKNISLSVSTSTHGLQISKETADFDLDVVNANSDARFSFNCNTESKIIEVQAICHYEMDGEKFEYYLRDSHDLNLKISISVQDIFRMSSIYSKFQIGCVNSQFPVRVSKCEYSCARGKYRVTCSSTAAKDNMSLVVYAEQPAYLFYKLMPITDEFDASDILDFTIRYSDLQKECERTVQSVLQLRLEEAGMQKYLFLLSSVITELQFDLLRFSVENKVCASNVTQCTTIMNGKVSKHVPPETRTKLTDILLSIFKDDVLIEPADLNVVIDLHELYIPVSVPYINTLHNVEFVLKEKSPFVVGAPVNTILVIHSSSKWSDLPLDNALASSSPRQSMPTQRKTFELTILNEEDWLISGLKRQNFHVEDRETTTEIAICLIPLNAGELVLPKVAIKATNDELSTMDLVQENALETVLVIPELESVTFAF